MVHIVISLLQGVCLFVLFCRGSVLNHTWGAWIFFLTQLVGWVTSAFSLVLVRPSSDQQEYSLGLNWISSARDSRDNARSFLMLCSASRTILLAPCAPLEVGGPWAWSPFHSCLLPPFPGWCLPLASCFLSTMVTSWVPKTFKVTIAALISNWKPVSFEFFSFLLFPIFSTVALFWGLFFFFAFSFLTPQSNPRVHSSSTGSEAHANLYIIHIYFYFIGLFIFYYI